MRTIIISRLIIDLNIGTSSTEQAIRNSNPNNQKVKKFPELTQYRLANKIRSLCGKQGYNKKNKNNDQGLTEQVCVRPTCRFLMRNSAMGIPE